MGKVIRSISPGKDAFSIQYEAVRVAIWLLITIIASAWIQTVSDCASGPTAQQHTEDRVLVSILVRNAARRLPVMLKGLEDQDLPKSSMSLLFIVGNCQDDTLIALNNWVDKQNMMGNYFLIRIEEQLEVQVGEDSTTRIPENWAERPDCAYQPHCWTLERYRHVAMLREHALVFARSNGIRYFVSLDTDVVLTNPGTLSKMIAVHFPIVAPLLYAHPNLYDSNVWLGIDPDNGGYVRHPNQLKFRAREIKGCINVASVHSIFLIDLYASGSQGLSFNSSAQTSIDRLSARDTSVLSESAKRAGVAIYGCNDQHYGFTSSVAGDNGKYSHAREAASFTSMVATRKLATRKPDYRNAAPSKTAVEQATLEQPQSSECSSSVCTRFKVKARDLQTQLEELRLDFRIHLDRAEKKGVAVACRWNGDCDPAQFVVDRRENLSLADFHREYSMQRKPVIVTDYVGAGRMSKTGNVFDAAYWKKKCGDVVMKIQSATKEQGWGGLSDHSSATLSMAFELLSSAGGRDDKSLYGIFDSPLPRSCTEFLEDFVMPKYFVNDYLQRVSTTLPLTYRDSWPSFFLGKANATANLHVDMFGSSFWMAVFQGHKHWRFVDESQRSFLYEDRATNDFPDIDLFNIDYTRFPLLKHVRIFDVVVGPGELLFVPGGSVHQVKNLDDTIALAGNYLDLGSLETARDEVMHPIRRGYSRYKELVDTIFHPLFPTGMDLEIGDLDWGQFKAQATWTPQ